ncbi:MAG: FAD-dependent oxidoreductase, partial [Planctomycetota bacterium]
MFDTARVVTILGVALAAAGLAPGAEVLIEAEAFAERGGWLVDQQFVDQMGSPYLLAHGMGEPVANARTTVEFPQAGTYRVHVRTKDWVPGFADGPGKFRVSVAGKELARVFGASRRGWGWEDGGTVDLPAGRVEIALKDLTGFEGRCDAIYFTTSRGAVPPNTLARMTPWRRRLLGLPDTPPSAGEFDLVVVGGGISGCAAAIQAARLGL